MQHNHDLDVKDKHYLVNDPLIMKEMDLFVKCKLSVANIYNIVKKKYQIKIRYQDVYQRVQQIKHEMGMKEIDIFKEQPLSQYERFVMMLQNEQQRYIDDF